MWWKISLICVLVPIIWSKNWGGKLQWWRRRWRNFLQQFGAKSVVAHWKILLQLLQHDVTVSYDKDRHIQKETGKKVSQNNFFFYLRVWPKTPEECQRESLSKMIYLHSFSPKMQFLCNSKRCRLMERRSFVKIIQNVNERYIFSRQKIPGKTPSISIFLPWVIDFTVGGLIVSYSPEGIDFEYLRFSVYSASFSLFCAGMSIAVIFTPLFRTEEGLAVFHANQFDWEGVKCKKNHWKKVKNGEPKTANSSRLLGLVRKYLHDFYGWFWDGLHSLLAFRCNKIDHLNHWGSIK